MIRDACISDCGLYRYSLTRDWEEENPLTMVFIMLNPSTADAYEDDPTIRRCISFAQREGCGALEVVNLFAFRATNPKEMLAAEDPVGPLNDGILCEAVAEGHHRVCAWGAKGHHMKRDEWALEMIREMGATPLALKISEKTGKPHHPLYLPADSPLVEL